VLRIRPVSHLNFLILLRTIVSAADVSRQVVVSTAGVEVVVGGFWLVGVGRP
jgi:hypothetical protein